MIQPLLPHQQYLIQRRQPKNRKWRGWERALDRLELIVASGGILTLKEYDRLRELQKKLGR